MARIGNHDVGPFTNLEAADVIAHAESLGATECRHLEQILERQR